MNTTELTTVVTTLVDDLAPGATAGGGSLGALLAAAEPITDDAAIHAQGWKIRMGSDGFPGFDTDRSSVATHSTQGFQAREGGEWMPCHQRRSRGLTLTA